MSNIQDSLDKYTTAKGAVDAHIEANKAVFDVHKNLVMNMIDRDNELRDEAVAHLEGLPEDKPSVIASNGSFKVIVTPQAQVFVDPEELKASEGKSLIPSVIAELIHTVKRPPRITISEQKQ